MNETEQMMQEMAKIHTAISNKKQECMTGTFSMVFPREQWQLIIDALEVAGEM